jgi:uncharacterized protein YbjT (DUF2867 family)
MILVTGAAGNIGGELVGALAEAGQPVRALTRSAGPAHARSVRVVPAASRPGP